MGWMPFWVTGRIKNGDSVWKGVKVISHFNKVLYHGVLLNKGGSMATLLNVTDQARVKVDAEMLDPEGRRLPYMLHTGNLWLVADVPFAYIGEEDRYLAFCDLLHDMLGVNHAVSHKALVRLEDVTPDDDAAMVRRAVDMLIDEGVPFQISLVPVFVDPGSRTEVHLEENPDLVKVLQYAMSRGGTLVLHGYTHQYRGVTPDDFEFWDGFRNAPRADDSAEMVKEKLDAALEECIRMKLYPIAWETPHYAASQVDYAQIAKVFSTLNEETMIDLQGTQQAFPYPTVDIRGIRIVPENIGYLPEDNPSPDVMLGNARAMKVVRDGMASAFMHSFLDLKYLQQAVQGIKALGYQFVSLREFDCRVALEDKLIQTGSAPKDIYLRDSYLKQFIINQDGLPQQETWSDQRVTGISKATLQPRPGQILVALGMDERPATPPSMTTRLIRLGKDWLTQWWNDETSEMQPLSAIRVCVVTQPKAIGIEKMNQDSFISVFQGLWRSPADCSTGQARTVGPESGGGSHYPPWNRKSPSKKRC